MSGPDATASGTAPPPNRYRAALRRLAPAFVAVLGFSAILNVLMLTGSIYMLQVYDRVLTSGSVPTLVGLFAIVVVLYGFLGLYDFLRLRLLSRGALRLDRDCGAAAYRLWLQPEATRPPMPPLRDLETVRHYLGSPGAAALFDLPFVPLFLGVLMLVHPALGLVTMAGAGVTAALALLARRLSAPALARTAALEAAEREFAEAGHRGAETLRAMRMDGATAARWTGLRALALAAGQSGSDPTEALAAASRAFRMLLQSAILTLGAFLVLRGEMSGGMIIAASILSGRALGPVDQLIGQWGALGRALAAHRRLAAAFGRPAPAPVAVALPAPTGAVALRRLTVLAPARPGAEPAAILKEIDLTLAPGEGLGVIGRSASGKSTLARTIVGALPPDRGEIRYDGATPDQWEPARLGRAIGYLPQQVEMLPGTVRDNIARFDPVITDKAVIEAARQAGIHEMILALADGYATRLDGAGAPRLSGGQLQRLGLARAICGGPRIVVLDEPNSNLDPDGDAAVTRTIAALREGGATVVVMAHRPSAIAAVDRLLVLEDGRIRALGPKEAVLAEMGGTAGQGRGHLRPVGGEPGPAEQAPGGAPAAGIGAEPRQALPELRELHDEAEIAPEPTSPNPMARRARALRGAGSAARRSAL